MTIPPLPIQVLVALEPVRLATPPTTDGASASGVPLWIWIAGAIVALAVIVAAGVIATGSVAAYRRVRALHPEEDAFRAIAKAMRLPPDHAHRIRVLAKRIDAAPVALLVSRSAFDRAAGVRAGSEGPGVASTRARVFGDDPPL